jgi:heme-degrading monooxygenase HmoA
VIARIWTGATHAADAEAYEDYMREVALPGYANVTGNRAVLMLRRARDDDRTEFTMVTVWDGMESVIAFTGPDPDRVVFYPRDERFLVTGTASGGRAQGRSAAAARAAGGRLARLDGAPRHDAAAAGRTGDLHPAGLGLR